MSVRHQEFTGDDIANMPVGIPRPDFVANPGGRYQASIERAAAQRAIARIVGRAHRSLLVVQSAYGNEHTDGLTLLTAQRTFDQVSLGRFDVWRELTR